MAKKSEKKQTFVVRNAMFTSFMEEIPDKPEWVKFVVYQREKCPKTGRDHWQICVCLENCTIRRACTESLQDLTTSQAHPWIHTQPISTAG